jgi:hypothetical protein
MNRQKTATLLYKINSAQGVFAQSENGRNLSIAHVEAAKKYRILESVSKTNVIHIARNIELRQGYVEKRVG